MAILNNEAALKYAKELTIVAMQNSMIATNNNPSKAAENIYECFKTLYEKFSSKTVE